MKALNPKVKLFMFIIDPVERAVSHIKMLKRENHKQTTGLKLLKTSEHISALSEVASRISNSTDSMSVYKFAGRDINSRKSSGNFYDQKAPSNSINVILKGSVAYQYVTIILR